MQKYTGLGRQGRRILRHVFSGSGLSIPNISSIKKARNFN